MKIYIDGNGVEQNVPDKVYAMLTARDRIYDLKEELRTKKRELASKYEDPDVMEERGYEYIYLSNKLYDDYRRQVETLEKIAYPTH